MRFVIALAFVAALAAPQAAFVSSANACTNSYDTAADGSICGGRAAGCRPGGASGIC